MKDAQKPNHISLTNLINWLSEGRFVIPDFQREFEWNPKNINALLRSIFLDYYIGSLLLWKGKEENFKALACEPLQGFIGHGRREYIVLDGQQRLSALYYACMIPDIPAPNRKSRCLYFIRVDRFMESAYDDAFEYDWKSRGVNLLANQEEQFKTHMFPLAVVGKGGWELGNWVQGYEKYWRTQEASLKNSGDENNAQVANDYANKARDFGDYLKGIADQYQIAYVELDCNLEIDKVCDIFTQINSSGISLDIFDLINALLKPKGLQLKHLWRKAEQRFDFIKEEKRMNVHVLQVMSILLQSYCSAKYLYYLLPAQQKTVRENSSFRKEILIPDADKFKEHWDQAVEALEEAIERLSHPQEFGAISSHYLPYVSILPVFASLQVEAKKLPNELKLKAQQKIRRWYWVSVFTNRYSGAAESTSARDYLAVKNWFGDNAAEPVLISELSNGFETLLDLRRETRRGNSIYNGIFNLLVLKGARDWVTGNIPQHGDLDDHHIIPKRWGKEQDLGADIDTILNRTPLTADTNRNIIRDRLPNEYLPELIDKSGESIVYDTLESHFISSVAFKILLRNPFTKNDFGEFLIERRRTIQNGIKDVCL